MGRKHSLTFGGINTDDYGIWITGAGTFAAPERDVEYVSVPGRNGDLIIDNNRWRNIEIAYPANIPNGFDAKLSAFRSAICRLRGYQRLEDSYHLDEFRMASFAMGLQPEPIPGNRGGQFDIVFNCKPQRFLKSGEMPLQFIPVVPATFRSQYIPAVVDEDVYVALHCPAEDELTIVFTQYDENLLDIHTTSWTATDGATSSFTQVDNAIYWRLEITDVAHLSDTWLEVRGWTKYNNTPISLDAIMCRNYTLLNPTGYAATPLIECYGDTLPYSTIENYRNGSLAYYYDFRTTSTGKTHFWMDCEIQYLYDDQKNNLTNKLILSTTGSEPMQGIVFPELGEEQIELQMYYADSDPDNGLGIINIYPRWWKL